MGLLVKLFYPSIRLLVHRRVDFKPGSSFFNRKKYLTPKVDRYVPISQAIAKILKEYGIPDSQITTVCSAVDPAPFLNQDPKQNRLDLAKELGLNPDLCWIANVAYHTEQKGMETLIRGLHELSKKTKNFVCLLAGEGHLTPKLQKMCEEFDIQEQVRFLGIRSSQDSFSMPRVCTAFQLRRAGN